MMRFVTFMSACTVFAVIWGGYAFSTWSVLPPEHVWAAIALSASFTTLLTALTLNLASYAWPSHYETMKYWWRDRDYVPYSDDVQVAVPREKLKTISFLAFYFGLFLLVGILAVGWARNYGVTLQPLSLGPTLEPLTMLLLLAVVGTTLIGLTTKMAEPTPA